MDELLLGCVVLQESYKALHLKHESELI